MGYRWPGRNCTVRRGHVSSVTKMLINCGIHSIWHAESYPDEMADAMLKEAGVQVGTLPLERDEHIDISDEVSPAGGISDFMGISGEKL